MEEKILNLEVITTKWVAESIKEIVLRDINGQVLPQFSAGAHLRFQLALTSGVVERCYSLLEHQQDPYNYRIAVSRAQVSSGGSAYMCDEVREGSHLQALPPKNDFGLATQADHHLLIAGGIGITPIYAKVKDLQEKGASMQLHYAARTPQAMAYREELEATLQDNAHFYFDNGDPARGIPLETLLSAVSANTHVYVCGPKPLIDSVRILAISKGLPESNIHFE